MEINGSEVVTICHGLFLAGDKYFKEGDDK